MGGENKAGEISKRLYQSNGPSTCLFVLKRTRRSWRKKRKLGYELPKEEIMKNLNKRITSMAVMILTAFLIMGGAAIADEITAAPLNPDFESVLQEVGRGTYGVSRTADGYALGYLPPPIDLSYLKAAGELRAQQTVSATALPATWDWRSSPGYNAVTSVKNQGSCGSCWSFGNMGAVESRYKIQTAGHPTIDLSENNMIDIRDSTTNRFCHWPWLWSRCNGGNTYLATSYLTGLVLQNATEKFQKGALLEAKDVYNASSSYANTKCGATTRPDPDYRIDGTRWIYGDTVLMKQAIKKYGPMVSAFYWDSSAFYSSGSIYFLPHWSGGTNHEILIVGWDDAKAWPDGSGNQGAWIVKNSWGTTWGLSGYFYLCYGSAAIGSDSMSYSGVRTANLKENFYAEDLGGWITNLGYSGSTSAYGSSVFKATVTGEKMAAVEFIAPFYGMPYSIKVWKAVTHPTSTTAKYATQWGTTITGKAQEPGYYTVALPANVMTAGKEYAVEVKFTSTVSSYYWPIPCACPISGVLADTHAKGNATGYIRKTETADAVRAILDSDYYLPNVRVRTLRP
jgi:C1A family cysteine protease